MKLIKNASADKLRGGYYTPYPIADFILKWGINDSKESEILEPSCGDGVFIHQLVKNQLPFKKLTGVEFNPEEAKKANGIGLKNTQILNTDFHQFCNETKNRFDLIIGNPPYIRYQYFEPQQQIEAENIFIKAGLKYSRLTNAWVSFVVGSSLLLKEKGKIGFVIPAELLQVSYAKQLRQFLTFFYNKINIISFKKLVFPGIQQEVVLLLCEKDNSSKKNIEHLELTDASELKALDVKRLRSPQKKLNSRGKWTHYFLEQKEIDFLEKIVEEKSIPLLKKYAKVEVGITTGSNSFFTVPNSIVEKYNLSEFTKPMVGRSVQVVGLNFSNSDWKKNIEKEARAHLLVFPENGKIKKYKGALEYIAQGESQNIHKGYKCSVREPWYVVPSLKISEGLFIRRNNLFPKLILNEANAFTTDTMHRVFIKQGINKKAFTSSFYNSLSFAFAEINGRSYGGGVLELMPSEVGKIPLPFNEANEDLFNFINKKLRTKEDILSILETTNNMILKDLFGFSKSDISIATSIWKKLSSRRVNRAKNRK